MLTYGWVTDVPAVVVSTLNPVAARNVASQSVFLISARAIVVPAAVVAVDRVVDVDAVLVEEVIDEDAGRVVLSTVTADFASPPPPQPAARTASVMKDAAISAVGRLACMHCMLSRLRRRLGDFAAVDRALVGT